MGEARTDVKRRKEGRMEVSENCILSAWFRVLRGDEVGLEK